MVHVLSTTEKGTREKTVATTTTTWKSKNIKGRVQKNVKSRNTIQKATWRQEVSKRIWINHTEKRHE